MGMACLSCHSTTRTLVVLASLPTNTNSSSPQSNTDPKPSTVSVPTTTISTRTTPPLQKKKRVQKRLQQQLNLMHVESVVGAGSYRDYEKPIDQEKKKKNSGFMEEGPVEKKLRETGEWVTIKTEGGFRSNGKRILMFSFQWAIPIYIFMVLVASGVIKLPFTSPFLDDLLM